MPSISPAATPIGSVKILEGTCRVDTDIEIHTKAPSDEIDGHGKEILKFVNDYLETLMDGRANRVSTVVCSAVVQRLGASVQSTSRLVDKMYTSKITWMYVQSEEHILDIIERKSFLDPLARHLTENLKQPTTMGKARCLTGVTTNYWASRWWVWTLGGVLSIGCLFAVCFTWIKLSATDDGSDTFEETDLIQPNHWKRAENIPLIGSGTFGIVYLSQNTINGKQFCTKEVDLKRGIAEESSDANSLAVEQESRMRHEIQLLAMYRHPRIVSYLGCEVSASRGRLFIFMEYLAGGTLKDNLKRYGHMDPKLVQMYTRDIMEGLKFLHTSAKPVVHRDIKPANVLLTLDGRCKLADFGCIEIIHQQEMENESKFIAGTRLYAPPEMIDGDGPATPAFDVWSLAVTIHRMLTNAHPWPALYRARPRLLIEYQRLVLANGLPPLDHPLLTTPDARQASDLIASMLVAAEDRPSIADLETHPFFKREYSDPCGNTSETEKRRAALNKLTAIRQGRKVSVTINPDSASQSASLFELPTASTKRRGRIRPEDQPRLEDILDDGTSCGGALTVTIDTATS